MNSTLPGRESFFEYTLQLVREGRGFVTGEPFSLDVARYHEPARLERERARVFGRFPLLVAHAAQLPEPGNCLAVDLPGRPLLLTRDEQGVLHAFYNVCRHRGSRLLATDGPCARRNLLCPYHAWSYSLDGRLKSVPQREEGFPGLDLSTRGLVELPLAELHGLLFVGARPGEALDLREWLGGIVDHWDAWKLGQYHFLRQSAFEVEANWKAIHDAFSESYHVQRLHRNTLSSFFMDNITHAETCGRHMVSCVARQAMREALDAPRAEWNLSEQSTFVYHVFPNVILVFSPDYVNVMSLLPLEAGRTRVEVMMMVTEAPADEAAREHWERSYDLIVGEVFVKEDFGIAASAQPGLACGANAEFLFGRFEWGIGHFHSQLDAALEDPVAG